MFQLSVELGGIQVAGELQAPCFVGCSEPGVCTAFRQPCSLQEREGHFQNPCHYHDSLQVLCNSLVGKLSRAVIYNDLEYCVQCWVPQYKKRH